MSDQQGTRDGALEDDDLAFEYASGLLRGPDRLAFEKRLETDESTQRQVKIWEEQLMNLNQEEPLEPKASTWAAIEQRTQGQPSRQATPFAWVWALLGAAATLAVVFLISTAPTPGPVSAVDYVAVMTNAESEPSLTTFGNAEQRNLTLHWQTPDELTEDEDYQLWAVSKRDGQTRSIAILDDQSLSQVDLSEATWRLITDAESLVLTREEAGGSAIDEPSEWIVASGVCVRINQVKAST